MKWIAGLLTLAATIGMVQAAHTPPLFKQGSLGIQLSDDILGAQRGKFVAGPNAHYFGIEFITHLTGPNGNIITNGMQLNVNMSRQQPKASVNIYTDGAKAAPHHSMPDNSPNGSGIVQVAQVAGSANIGINDLSFQHGIMATKGSPLTPGYYQVSLPSGIAHYEFTTNGLGMSYTSTDQKINATQMVRSSKGNQGLVQQLNIADSNRLLSNEAKFYIGDQINSKGDLAKTLQQQLPTGLHF